MGKISASLMCIDYKNFKRDINTLKDIGIDYIHIDIMDGHFVPNFTLGPDIVKAVRSMVDIPIELHLMVENPENYIDIFEPEDNDIVCIHQESTAHLQRVLNYIKEKGAIPSVAINPATPIVMIKHILCDVKVVCVMTVNPGFSGQKFVPETLNKIKELKELILKKELDVEIEVDGNVSFENARKMKDMGADIFVAGTSSLFSKDMSMDEAGRKFKEIIA
jgi:ribulose-phosphate 3-epimerase